LYPYEVVDGCCVKCRKEIIEGSIVKMSKSKKNVVDPEELIKGYGADTVRMFCLFASPPDKDLEWSDRGVDGSSRFLGRVWRLVDDNLDSLCGVRPFSGNKGLSDSLESLHRKTHATIKKVTEDIDKRFHFNTGISAVMELVNEIYRFLNEEEEKGDLAWSVIRKAVETAIVLLSPVVPHMTEELWQRLGNQGLLLDTQWPVHDEQALKAETRLVVLQVNGKVRSKIEVPASLNEKEIEAAALANERIRQFVQEKPIRKVIVVQKKLVNIVL
ncbi:MAG: class I tRNA ligase family protein, partial [Desulfobulbaceae bacterium]|nr:class I tRNA ligase family protein [Desulfobulbaceae bacterium]